MRISPWTGLLRPVLAAALALVLLAACAAPDDAAGGSDAVVPETSTEAGADPDGTADDDGQAPDADGEDSDGPIVFGLNIELSGGASVQGQAYADAAELWAEQVNAEGGILGREVELEILDNGSDQTEAVVLTRQLTERGVVAMIGPGTSPTTLAAMDAIRESGIPTFSMGSAEAIVTPVEERANVFKPPFGSRTNVDAAIDHLEGLGITSVGLIAVNDPYGDSGVAAWEAAQEEGSTVELVGVERFEAADTDMTAQLNNLVSAGAEAIFVQAIPPGAPTVRRSAVESLGLDLPMIFDAGAGAELFIELAGSASDGALVTHPPTLIWDQIPSDDPQYEALQEFGSAYTDAYGAMSGFAGYAWDALGLTRAAIEESGSTDPEAITAALESLGSYVGVDGVYELSAEDHQGLSPEDLHVLQVVDGAWAPAEGDPADG